jgi:hypothetical protein
MLRSAVRPVELTAGRVRVNRGWPAHFRPDALCTTPRSSLPASPCIQPDNMRSLQMKLPERCFEILNAFGGGPAHNSGSIVRAASTHLNPAAPTGRFFPVASFPLTVDSTDRSLCCRSQVRILFPRSHSSPLHSRSSSNRLSGPYNTPQQSHLPNHGQGICLDFPKS